MKHTLPKWAKRERQELASPHVIALVYSSVHLFGTLILTVYTQHIHLVVGLSQLGPALNYLFYASLLLPFNYLVAFRIASPIARLRHALDAALPLDPADLQKALSFPRRLSTLFAIKWLSIGGAFPLFLLLTGRNESQLLHAMLATLLVTISCTFLCYYSLGFISRYAVVPQLLSSGHFPQETRLRFSRVWMELLAFVIAQGTVSPLAIIGLQLSGVPTHLLLLISACLLLFFLGLSVPLILSIAHPIGHLSTQMKAVERGELDQQAAIFATDTLGLLSDRFNHMLEGLRQREFIRETFGRYVTHQIADTILSGSLKLGGERRTATVLFSDIRGFTSMSEHLEPEEVVHFLNTYFTHMVNCVLDNGGVLDKFIGDAVMALFGVPSYDRSDKENALAAVKSALAMLDALHQINATREEQGAPPIAIGIGLHTGELVAGNIGSNRRMEYTVIGDTVNLCSRIESLTKDLEQPIILSESTAALVRDQVPLSPLCAIAVRGRTEPTQLFAPTSCFNPNATVKPA